MIIIRAYGSGPVRCQLTEFLIVEAQFMKFNNLERNVLYLLGKEWLNSGTLDSFDTGWIFEKFSDIPDENMYAALRSLKERGLAELTSDYRNISLTPRGLSKIEFIQLPENGTIPFPGQL
jgi:hypothetical protein